MISSKQMEIGSKILFDRDVPKSVSIIKDSHVAFFFS